MSEFLTKSVALFAAGIESLIVFAILAIIGALSSMWQKRQEAKRQGSRLPEDATGQNWPDQSSSGPARTPASNWEEELKRLLGEAPAEPPPPPPIVVGSRPAPAPPVPPPLVVVRQQTFPLPGHRAETHEECPTLETAELVVTPPVLGRLDQSHSAMTSASHLDELVAARLAQVTTHPVALTRTAQRRTASAEVAEVVAMFRQAKTARQAFIASQIFGPPRALEGMPR